MHDSTFDYLLPSARQKERMEKVRAAAKAYFDVLRAELPDGPDKTYTIRSLRTVSMWANICITRQPDGTPRVDTVAVVD